MVRLTYLLALLPLVAGLPAPTTEGKYIVTFNQAIPTHNFEEHMTWVKNLCKHRRQNRGDGNEEGVEKVWTRNFKGYSGEFDAQTAADIKSRDEVADVEPIRVFKTAATETQTGAPWGLGSISHRTPNWNQYLYDSTAGQDTWIYVLDTGVNIGHVDFEGRAFLGYNAYPGVAHTDTVGHGTHCAGTAVSRTYGVAKKANVMSVKVFGDGDTTTDIVIDGYEWAINNITATPNRAARSVVSMSIAGNRSPALNAAIESGYQRGVVTVVAAGNFNDNANNYSPASAPNAITVAAIDINNNRASFSNFGSRVDLFAPGVGILSTWIGSSSATATLSGTSMACPHVAGLVLYLKAKEGLVSPASVTNRIKTLATRNVVTNMGQGSPNLLAYNGIV